MDKAEYLKRLENLVRQKMTERERIWMLGNISSRIVCVLTKHLIKTMGYGVTSTIVERELKELGKKDARRLMEILELNEKNLEAADKILKVAALLLGMKLRIEENRTIIEECPHGRNVRELNDPFFCNVCLHYCRGILEEIVGPEFILKQDKSIHKGDPHCHFVIEKRD